MTLYMPNIFQNGAYNKISNFENKFQPSTVNKTKLI